MWASLLIGLALAGSQDIREAEWRRDVGALVEHLEGADAKERAELARSLGRSRSAEALEALSTLVRDENVEVRRAALAALAWVPGGEGALREALTVLPLHSGWGLEDVSGELRGIAYWALGHHGDKQDVDRLIAGLSESGAAALGAAQGLGRMGRDGVASAKRAQPALLLLASRDLGKAPAAAAYALGRIGCDPEHAPKAALRAQEAPEAESRAFLVRAAAPGLDDAGLARLVGTALGDRDPVVRTAGLSAVREGLDADLVIPALADPSPWVQSSAVRALGKLGGAGHEALLERAALANPHHAAEAVDALLASGATALEEWSSGPVPVQAAVAAHATPERAVELTLESKHAAVRSAAAGALLGVEAREPKLALELGTRLSGAADPIVRAVAMTVLKDGDPASVDRLLLDVLRVESDADVLTEGLGLLVEHAGDWKKVPEELAVILRRAGTLGSSRLTTAAASLGQLAAVELPEPKADERLSLPLSRVGLVRSAIIETTRGEIVVELDHKVAPLAVWNFARLADTSFYDDALFHRVVPAFVVQTGCPRGDGWGGPGWTLPDEVSDLPYIEGALGMARSDRDTGGSQWFITTTSQPHLTGDYTLFGRVTRGMPVVRSLGQGDQVLDIRIERVREGQ
ncbi:MAG: peptidylprolyl isomerase [Proteobacteria bacterium]|nr:peptidylprolyl isomerase [Pseudomonadota bacterium]